MSQKKRSFEPKPIQDVLHQITEQRNLAKGLNELKVKQAWEATVGNNVMQFTQELSLRGKTLYIHLSSAPLREELSYGKEKILKHLNDTLGFEAIQKIVLR
jgi:predicted nucleic acid-binding Zn ribbon protein